MSTAVNGNQLHLHVGVVAPQNLLHANSAGQLPPVCFRRAGDVVEVRKVLGRLPRRTDFAQPVEQTEEADRTTVERDQRVFGTVHDQDGGRASSGGPALEVLRRRHVCRHRRDGAKPGGSFESQPKRHETAAGTTGREHATRVDPHFADEFVDHRRQETNVIDTAPVGPNLLSDCANVPVAVIRIRIDHCKAMRVRKAVKSIPRLDAHVGAVLARAMQHQNEWRSVRQPPRHVGPIRPPQPIHLDTPQGQLAGQSWHFRSRRIDKVGEQRTKHHSQPDNDDHTPNEDAENLARDVHDTLLRACFASSSAGPGCSAGR